MATAEDALPYGIGYSKTTNLKCRDCNRAIERGSMYISTKEHKYLHEDCFWKLDFPVLGEVQIQHFERLEWTDQETVRAQIKEASKDHYKTMNGIRFMNLQYEYKECAVCQENIPPGNVIGAPNGLGYHPECFVTTKKQFEIEDLARTVDEMNLEELKEYVKRKKALKEKADRADNGKAKCRIKAATNIPQGLFFPGAESATLHRKISATTQTDKLRGIEEHLTKSFREHPKFKTKEGKINDIIALIKFNGGIVSKDITIEECVHALTDIIAFGGFAACPSCNEAKFCYNTDRRGYQCMGTNEKSSCQFFDRNVERKPFKMDLTTSKMDFLFDSNKKIMLYCGRIYPLSVEARSDNAERILGKRKEILRGRMKENGFVVDELFDACDAFHVYVSKDGVVHQCLLGCKSKRDGSMKFVLIQLLEPDNGKGKYYVFRRIGAVKAMKGYESLEEALKLFEEMVEVPTNKEWLNAVYEAASLHDPGVAKSFAADLSLESH